MKVNRKPASTKAWAMLRKLEALAERGVDGEKLAAQRKIDRLKARFDFEVPSAAHHPDLFQGSFKRSSKAKWIYSFQPAEFDVANAVKWAIESATGIRCLHRDCDLLAEAAPGAANRLASIAEHISQSFRTLLAKLSTVNGFSVADRGVFMMGLYDGMMNDLRDVGQPLPSRPVSRRKGRLKKQAVSPATALHVHPYTLAVGLGRQIRFSVPLQEIAAELDSHAQARLASEAGPPDPRRAPRHSSTNKAHSALPG
jgi:hypothetical protein